MSPAPVDPHPDFVPGQAARANEVDDRYKRLYDALDKTVVGLDAASIKDLAITTALLADGSVAAAKLADAAVTAAKIEVQQAWQTIALAGFTAANLAYYKDSLGIVHFRGDVLTSASPAAGATLCTLPAGYRPGTTIYQMICLSNAQGASVISIDAAGVVKTISALAVNPWAFAACNFRAEN